jgi:hypothetical protein
VTTFRERLVVPWWWWPAAAVIVAVLGGELHLGNSLAWNVGSAVAVAVAGAALLAGLSHSRVVVADGVLRAGPAAIPVSSLGPAAVRHGEDLRLRLGPGADPAAFLLIRSWVRTAVEIAVVDPADDTPYWIVSTRRPRQLLAALAEQRAPSPTQTVGYQRPPRRGRN